MPRPRLTLALALVAWLPVLVHLAQAVSAGWWPTNDDALTGLAARDVTTGHPPVMGPRTTTAIETGVETHHPGPALYYLLAVPSALFGHRPVGLLVGGALLTLLWVYIGVRAARSVGGVPLAGLVAVAFLGLQWALGPGAALRPFNPYPPALATLALLVLVWALLLEKLEWAPAFAFVASVCVQSHLGYVVYVAVPVLLLLMVGIVRWGRRRRALWPMQGWTAVGHRPRRGPALVTGAVLLLVWLPPLVELFRFSPNNLEQVLAYIGAERGEQLSRTVVVPFLVAMLAPLPGGFRVVGEVQTSVASSPVTDGVTPWAVALGAALLLALVVVAAYGRLTRRLGPTARTGAVAALVGLASITMVVGQLAESSADATWNYLSLWPTVIFAWVVVLASLWRPLTALIPDGRVREASLAGGGVLVAGVLGAAFASPSAVDWGAAHELREGSEQVLAAVEDAVQADPTLVAEDGRPHVVFASDSLGAGYSIVPAVAYGLAGDTHVHLPALWKGEEDTDFRKTVSAPEHAAHVFVHQVGEPPVRLPRGMRGVAQVAERPAGRYQIFVGVPEGEPRHGPVHEELNTDG